MHISLSQHDARAVAPDDDEAWRAAEITAELEAELVAIIFRCLNHIVTMRKGAASRNTAWDISPPDQTRLILGVPNETWQSSDRDLFGCYWQRLGPRDPAAAQHTRTREKDASLSGCNAFFGREKLDHSAAIFERSDARRHGRALRTDLERAIERSRGLNEPVHLA